MNACSNSRNTKTVFGMVAVYGLGVGSLLS